MPTDEFDSLTGHAARHNALDAAVAAPTFVSATAPVDPAEGATWLDTSVTPNLLKVWVDGSPGAWVGAGGGGGDASEIDYDNTTSGLAATDVQAAIDELVEMIPSGVVDNAPTIAQTLWWESAQFGGSDAGFNTQESGYAVISTDAAERSLRFITGAGTTNNVFQWRAQTPTWDLRVGAAAYSNRSRAVWVLSKPVPGVLARIACGVINRSAVFAGVLPGTLIGVQKDESDNWSICFRVGLTDLQAPTALTISEGQRILVAVQITGNGSTAITEARVGVFDYDTGVLIDKATWSGSNTAIISDPFEIWTARPDGSTGSPGAQETLRMYYQAYGPVPSPTLNPFFAQL
jgi:hypothetical protein